MGEAIMTIWIPKKDNIKSMITNNSNEKENGKASEEANRTTLMTFLKNTI